MRRFQNGDRWLANREDWIGYHDKLYSDVNKLVEFVESLNKKINADYEVNSQIAAAKDKKINLKKYYQGE
jgi:hypothetical protein